ncbi:protein translocase subunit SecF [Raineyella fluvialis]|uniref:Protein-export membrane protein SecF n=1 Tax=Raineyella fluvialis TaxID=2662261 RepID=A0A5Q2FC87_9ACTN|nr:protein translocase subunit SecF [Raineyella fluvialis]QGF24512.1 protein translocase subunit SecF [Raineyella fluvialis]
MATPFRALVRLSHGENVFDLLSRRRRWYVISAVVLTLCIVGLFVRGLNLSIEFRGGSDFRVPHAVTATTVTEAQQVVAKSGVPDLSDITVTTIGANTVQVQTRSLTSPEVTEVRGALARWAGVPSEQVSYSLIGASWGKQITQKGIIALSVFLVLVGIAIALYFRDWRMAVAAIVAVLHDLLVTIGIYAWVGFSVTPATLTALLTILGYSLYDTMVVFDRVRENVHELPSHRETYTSAANRSLNEVLVRSINTTIIGVLPVLALLIAGVFVLGTGPIKDLSLAMFVGMIAGSYSSIFIAASLLVDMKERTAEMRDWRRKLARHEERERQREESLAAAMGAQTTSTAPVVLAVDVNDTSADVAPAPPQPLAPGDRHQPQHRTREQRRGH